MFDDFLIAPVKIVSRYIANFLAPRPIIRKAGSLLIIESAWRTAFFTLGARHRKVAIEPQSRIVRIADRRFWLFTNLEIIEFDQISEISYTYKDLGSDWTSHTSQDLFTIGLNLKSGRHISLFKLYGEGDFINNSIWPDWMMWEDFAINRLAVSGQEAESQYLADVLCHLTGAPISDAL